MAEFGILCHITSLRNRFGLGDFGRVSYEFVDFLKSIGATVWEVLPLNITNDFNCPYGAMSIFSFDEMFVDLEELCEIGLLEKSQLKCLKTFEKNFKVDFAQIKPKKLELFERAYHNLTNKDFLAEVALKDKKICQYAYWRTLLEVFEEEDWRKVDKKLWKMNSPSGKKFVEENLDIFFKYVFFQYVLKNQWKNLKDYANKNGIRLFGDLPAYCDKMSEEVFFHPECVKLDKNFLPLATGGAPADMMSATGQDWGTCVYNWDRLRKENFEYLLDRIETLLERYDILRLDHFMAYVEFYEIPKDKKSKPRFAKGGGEEFFEKLKKRVKLSNLVLEDIGVVTEDSQNVKKRFNLCGMNVLQFAFDTDEKNPNLPFCVKENSVFYTETHDSNTFFGFLKSLDENSLERCRKFLGCEGKSLKGIQFKAIKSVLCSKAKIAIIPIQDLMMLDERFRMNYAGVAEGCWEYRVQKNFKKVVKGNLKKIFANNKNIR